MPGMRRLAGHCLASCVSPWQPAGRRAHPGALRSAAARGPEALHTTSMSAWVRLSSAVASSSGVCTLSSLTPWTHCSSLFSHAAVALRNAVLTNRDLQAGLEEHACLLVVEPVAEDGRGS